MTRPNKLEHLSLETLSSQVLEFEGKDRANPMDNVGLVNETYLYKKLACLSPSQDLNIV